MKYYIIGDEDTVLGFGMVGVEGTVITTAEEAEQAFNDALQSQEIGILIITEQAAEMIRTQVDEYLFSERFPLIVEIPNRTGRVPEKPSLREMVNQAIGIQL